MGANIYHGDLLGSDPKGNYARITDDARDAVGGIGAQAMADAIGAMAPLTEELARSVLEGLKPRAGVWRQVGVLCAEVSVADDAPLRDRLLRLAGYDPDRHHP